MHHCISHLRQCISVFAVAERWLLLDIGWFVLFLKNCIFHSECQSSLTNAYARWCFVNKQPRIRKLSVPDVSCLIWDQGHYKKYHLCFLPRFTIVVRMDGKLHTSIYDKRDDFNFRITEFPFRSSNIPSSPAFGVLRYVRTCHSYEFFLFWRQDDFSLSYLNRDTSWNAWNCHSGSCLVDTGILFSNMTSASHEY